MVYEDKPRYYPFSTGNNVVLKAKAPYEEDLVPTPASLQEPVVLEGKREENYKEVPWHYPECAEVGNMNPNGRCIRRDNQNRGDPKGALSGLGNKNEAAYDVATQLKSIPAQISVWELLCTSRIHREMFAKTLNDAHVSSDTAPEMIALMIGQLLAPRAITFTDNELPPEGRDHGRSLNIALRYKDLCVPLVLIDNGSSLNVCPLKTAERLGINPSSFRPSTICVRAFDNTRRSVEGEVDIEVQISPEVSTITFQILDISASFNMLLEQPWL